MEDYHYFPTSWWTAAGSVEAAGFPGHTTVPRNRGSASPRTRRLASRGDADAGELHHYLDACFRCGRHLGGNKDIFMYRGDTPFCSDECRRQQIEDDEASEKKRSRQQHAATKRDRERQRRSSSSPQRIPPWAR